MLQKTDGMLSHQGKALFKREMNRTISMAIRLYRYRPCVFNAVKFDTYLGDFRRGISVSPMVTSPYTSRRTPCIYVVICETLQIAQKGFLVHTYRIYIGAILHGYHFIHLGKCWMG